MQQIQDRSLASEVLLAEKILNGAQVDVRCEWRNALKAYQNELANVTSALPAPRQEALNYLVERELAQVLERFVSNLKRSAASLR